MRTAIYCRVSTPGQRDTTSLPEQERIDREKALQLGWEVSEAHVYKEVEGGEDLYRPQMDRLWEAIMRHEIDGVVIDVIDRLSRDEGDQGAVYHHAGRYGVQIEVASANYDETEHGRDLRTLAGIVARHELADIRRRTQRGRKARIDSGKMMTGAWPLYGYLWADPTKGQRSSYIIDPETAWVVVRIFTDIANGKPIRQLARELEQEGVPTPFMILEARGQLPAGRTATVYWRRGQIQRMLHHPAYWGEHSANRWEQSKRKVRSPETGITIKVHQTRERALDDEKRVALPNTAPALVSVELVARAHAQLTQNKRDSAGRNPDPLATIWRGMAICGHCGSSMSTGATRHSIPPGDDRRYYCRAHRAASGGAPPPCPGGRFTVTAKVLDSTGWADVRAWLEKPENVSCLLAEWEQEVKTGEHSVASRLEASAATIATLRDKMNALAETISETSKGESRRTLQEKLDRYADQVTVEAGKRERLMREAREATDRAREERDVREWVRIVASTAATASREEQRATLLALGAKATIWRTDYVHPDGWPQRYRIVLNFTGFSDQFITLPANRGSDNA